MSRVKPGLRDAYVRPNNELYKDEEGNLRHGYTITMRPDDWEPFRHGYKCLRCHTVQDEPFPEVCKAQWKDGGGCGFRMRDEQRQLIEFEFRGEEQLWPDWYFEQIAEEREREDFRKRTGVWLPGRD